MSHVIAGPMASLYLAQLGAEVVKIEPPGAGEVMRASRTRGDGPECGDTPAFAASAQTKQSVAVDIRTAEGAAIVRDLARRLVFIENFRPGVVKRHGWTARPSGR